MRLSGPDASGDLTLNIGTGQGASVRELIDLIADVSGNGTPAIVEPRRPGDAPRAVGSSALAEEELGWKAQRGVREMVESAWVELVSAPPGGDREVITSAP